MDDRPIRIMHAVSQCAFRAARLSGPLRRDRRRERPPRYSRYWNRLSGFAASPKRRAIESRNASPDPSILLNGNPLPALPPDGM